jgi:sensor histidine kinase YesM
MIISSLIFAVLSMIALDLMFHPELSLSHIRFSKNMILNGQVILLAGCLICICFYNEEKQYITEKRTIKEREKRIKNEKMVTETYLRLLQAQIEPHFLFNTLTSILSLSKNDPQKAKKMLNNFMQYLETTLSKTRASVTTIGQDIELLKTYLEIFKVRMGKRLQYSVKADDEVKNLPFPSMLIQPIVENAVKHGLEPKIDGGKINIQVKMIEDDRIRWNIEDTGLGMSDKANKGTGLSNIKERLKSLYGDEGHLTLMDNIPSGVKVTLEVPYV